MKQILEFLLGAGKGILGTIARAAAAMVSGWLLSKGWVDGDLAASVSNNIESLLLLVYTIVGSVVNNKVQLEKPSPK